jgi:hypothetical protein
MPGEPNPASFPDPTEMWKQWYETSANMWSRMMDGSITKNEPPFADPFAFIKQWYEASSEAWSKMADDVMANEEFLKAASEFLSSYARLYRSLRHNNEEYWHNLQLPTRGDVARVAELVVALEDKVDGIDDTLDDLAQLKQRLDVIERKLDSLVETMKAQKSASPKAAAPAPRRKTTKEG